MRKVETVFGIFGVLVWYLGPEVGKLLWVVEFGELEKNVDSLR